MMKLGRVISGVAVSAALIAAALVAIQLGQGKGTDRSPSLSLVAPATSSFEFPSTVSSSLAKASPKSTVKPTKKPTPTPTPSKKSSAPMSVAPAKTTANPVPTQAPAPARLPVGGSTADAQQVITVTASSWGTTRAVVQAWNRNGSGWAQTGPSVSAWIGGAGMSTNAREGFDGTPVGSFPVTQAFGNYANPGTSVPYFQAGPNDWWDGDSQSKTYNTHQRCSSCPFRTSESENLHDIGWVYGYAVVINYNMNPVVAGKGSAFFLHITNNEPTGGCVAIPQADLARIMQWLNPAKHPRIIIGVS